MLEIDESLTPAALKDALTRFWELSGEKIKRIDAEYDHAKGSPVFTVAGKYTTRGWTEWTQGFEFGSAVLQFDATGDDWFLDFARKNTVVWQWTWSENCGRAFVNAVERQTQGVESTIRHLVSARNEVRPIL